MSSRNINLLHLSDLPGCQQELSHQFRKPDVHRQKPWLGALLSRASMEMVMKGLEMSAHVRNICLEQIKHCQQPFNFLTARSLNMSLRGMPGRGHAHRGRREKTKMQARSYHIFSQEKNSAPTTDLRFFLSGVAVSSCFGCLQRVNLLAFAFSGRCKKQETPSIQELTIYRQHASLGVPYFK